ncbi:MAG: NAD-dependent epimerase/dehydratase family protein [Candidatus Paceibacterota bacterium]|jgi:nucleoside-diphosphate-sugar epimerase
MRILITGAAGYIGGMLTDQFKEGPDVQILALDIKDQPKEIDHPRITWCIGDLRKSDWFSILGSVKPDVIVHCAWAASGNEEMANNVFDYCVRQKIPKFIYLSAIDGYGNISDRYFIENDPLRATDDRYGLDVVASEHAVKKLYGGSGKHTQTFILRLPIIFGPRGWQQEHFFGTLGLFKSGGLPLVMSDPDSIIFQAVHEDDLVDIIGLLAFNKLNDRYEVFNITPEDTVPASGIAATFGKKVVAVSKAVRKLVPFNNSSRLTSSILADGSKFTKKFKYKFNYTSYEAITTEEGKYGTEQN